MSPVWVPGDMCAPLFSSFVHSRIAKRCAQFAAVCQYDGPDAAMGWPRTPEQELWRSWVVPRSHWMASLIIDGKIVASGKQEKLGQR